MKRMYNKQLRENARSLRREMTKEERHLWYDFLAGYPIQFYRQKVIQNYIADFYCSQAHLVVELDGSQHFETAIQQYDEARTRAFAEYGIHVLRFTNLDITHNFKGVCEKIDIAVKERL